jgi:uncharacterized RDD family membrane protein YckC
MAFCTVCGSQLDDGARFCVKCGRAVASEMSAAQSIPAFPAASVAIPAPVPGGAALPLPIGISPYAGFWLRVLASLIDSAILGIPFAAILATSFFTFGGVALIKGLKIGPGGNVDASTAPAMAAAIIPVYGAAFLGIFILSWLYYAAMESSARQGTLGKVVLGLRVTDANGARLTFGHATGRHFAKIVTGFIPLGIGWMMAGFTAKKQALHDMIAGTLVYRDN